MRKNFLRLVLLGGLLAAVLSVTAFAEHDETDIPYEVTGGNIWFESFSGSITDCDNDVKEVIVPAEINHVTVTAIGNYAFATSAVEKITLPNTITRIRPGGFWNCNGIKNISLPMSIEHIGESAFGACYGLRRIAIPERISVIEPYTFAGCNALLSVSIPLNVTEIASFAFQGCSELADVYYAGTQEQWNNITVGTENDYLLSSKLHINSAGPELPVVGTMNIALSAPSFGASVPLTVTGTGTRTVNFYTAFYNQNRRFIGVESVQKAVYSGLQSVFVPVNQWAFVPTMKAFALDDDFRPLSLAAGSDAGDGEDMPEKYSDILSEADVSSRNALVDALTEQEAKDFVKQFAGWLH